MERTDLKILKNIMNELNMNWIWIEYELNNELNLK